uniref:small lysine-rich protein 1 n=1 Tax=Gasterosteus aculeatus aculeatus TaxID=481459 RepID=UPI001A9810F5|nr:small lysine-rich protein 1 [Gasterosteus aculeatus aculeatus]
MKSTTKYNNSRPTKKTASKNESPKRSSSAKSPQTDVDILSPAAMQNAYYISHNAMDCLRFRGFGWQSSKEKKKGTKRIKKK